MLGLDEHSGGKQREGESGYRISGDTSKAAPNATLFWSKNNVHVGGSWQTSDCSFAAETVIGNQETQARMCPMHNFPPAFVSLPSICPDEDCVFLLISCAV